MKKDLYVLVRSVLLCAVSICLLSNTTTWAARTAVYPRVVAAEIKGLVLYADGTTPAVRVPIRIYSVSEREFIAETETNEEGLYKLPKLDPGEYFITYDWTKLRVTVIANGGDSTQQPHDIIIVIPRDVGAVSPTHLSSVLFATTLTEAASELDREDDIPPVVSP